MLSSNCVPSTMLDSEGLKANETLWIAVIAIASGIVTICLACTRLCVKSFIYIIIFNPCNSSM